MSLLRLSLIVAALAISVVLALTNPTVDQYLAFVEGELAKAMDRMDQSTPEREGTVVRNIFRRHSQELLNSMVRPHTVRQLRSASRSDPFALRGCGLGRAATRIHLALDRSDRRTCRNQHSTLGSGHSFPRAGGCGGNGDPRGLRPVAHHR